MAKYRKKPVVIEAMQYNGTNELALMTWAGFEFIVERLVGGLEIETLEGVMKADAGDWIIRGIKGEYYPCKPEIFEATYEIAE